LRDEKINKEENLAEKIGALKIFKKRERRNVNEKSSE
jgi:hypothetical protein